jgi:hypothetical protein
VHKGPAAAGFTCTGETIRSSPRRRRMALAVEGRRAAPPFARTQTQNTQKGVDWQLGDRFSATLVIDRRQVSRMQPSAPDCEKVMMQPPTAPPSYNEAVGWNVQQPQPGESTFPPSLSRPGLTGSLATTASGYPGPGHCPRTPPVAQGRRLNEIAKFSGF